MNQRTRLIALTTILTACMNAQAAELLITVNTGDTLKTFTRPITVGQVVDIDERKSVDFKSMEGCAGLNISGLPTTVETGLQLKIDAVQDLGDVYLLRFHFTLAELAGTRQEQYRSGCTMYWPMRTVTNTGPASTLIPRAGKTPTEVFKIYTAASGKQTTLSLQIK